MYGALATGNGAVTGLETDLSRQQIRDAYAASSKTNKDESRLSPQHEQPMEGLVAAGNQAAYMATHASDLSQGIDPQDIEGRNEQWTNGVAPNSYHRGGKVLWIVGASHLAGLNIELRKKGWAGGAHILT